MLNPKQDRIDYCQTMTPPFDFHLDFAVGTSYSLDFETLVCLLSSLGDIEYKSIQNNPVLLLNILQDIGKKIVIFCENGQIKVPQKQISSAFLLYEEIVHTINKDKGSFHPKFWLIRYKHDKMENNYLYRLIILSRNLTFDRSWDVIFSVDGEKGKKENEKNQPICKFLSFLKENLKRNENKKKKLAEIIKELPFINFEINTKNGIDELDFIPLGIKGYSYENELLKPLWKKKKEIAIFSPFLSEGFFEKVTVGDCSKQFLLTR